MKIEGFSRRESTLILKEIYKEFAPHKRLGRFLAKVVLRRKEEVPPVLKILKYATLLKYSKAKNKIKN